MDFRFSDTEDAWRHQVRAFFQRALTPEMLADMRAKGTTHIPELWKKMGEEGWLGIAWPKEYGGSERTPWEQLIFEEEAVLAGTPLSTLAMLGNTIGQLGGMIIHHGNEEQKREWLPAIAAGDMTSAEGLTEPNAGSDLAGLETKAVREGDDWILNGCKIFNQAHLSTHFLVLARTDPTLSRHRGLSFFVVDTQSPGMTILPLISMGRWRRDAVYFEDVRVPHKMMLGEVNRGWYQFLGKGGGHGSQARTLADVHLIFDEVVEYVKRESRDGEPLREIPWVRQTLADLAIEIESADLLSNYVAWLNTTGQESTRYGSMAKAVASELQERVLSAGMDILGPVSALESWGEDTPGVPLKGKLPQFYRDARLWEIAGGTNELKRNIVAQRGLGLPKD